MSVGQLTPWVIWTVMAVLFAAVLGWVIGSGSAAGRGDAEEAWNAGFRQGYETVFAETRTITASRGFKTGAVRGKRAGARTGLREGAVIGAGNAEIEQAVASQKSAESAAAAAQSEIAARSANCGVVPAAPSWCPTGDELDAWKAAVQEARKAAEEAEKDTEKQKEKPGNGRP